MINELQNLVSFLQIGVTVKRMSKKQIMSRRSDSLDYDEQFVFIKGVSRMRLLSRITVWFVCGAVSWPVVVAAQEAELDITKQDRRNDSIEQRINGKFSPEIYKVKNEDSEEVRLKKQRINAALMEMAHYEEIVGPRLQLLDTILQSQDRLLRAQLDFHTKPEEIVRVLRQALEFAKKMEAIILDQFEEGANVDSQMLGQAIYNRLDREIELRRAIKKYGFGEQK